MHAEAGIALVLLSNSAGDNVNVCLCLLHGDARLQPHHNVVVFVAPVFLGIGSQGQRRKDIHFVHGDFRRHHFGGKHECTLQYARYGEWIAVEHDGLPYDPWV